MKIAVQLFSRLRDDTGAPELTLELAEGATIQDALTALYQAQPALAAWDRSLLTAIGVEYEKRDRVLAAGETLMLFPPVQGG